MQIVLFASALNEFATERTLNTSTSATGYSCPNNLSATIKSSMQISMAASALLIWFLLLCAACIVKMPFIR